MTVYPVWDPFPEGANDASEKIVNSVNGDD